MEKNAAVGRAQGFAQADLVSTFADRDQHDVDHADRSQCQGDHADRSKEYVHNVKNGADHLRFLDGIPFVKGILVVRIEAVIVADDLVNLVFREKMLRSHARLILDEGNGVLVVLTLDGEIRGHDLERNIATHVEPVVVASAQMRNAADDLETDSIHK